MGLVGCPETSVKNCHYLRNNAEQCSSQSDSRLSRIFLNTPKDTLCAKFISINTHATCCGYALSTTHDVIAPTLYARWHRSCISVVSS
jgi:hypothetical protein